MSEDRNNDNKVNAHAHVDAHTSDRRIYTYAMAFYIGGNKVDKIVRNLLKKGLSPSKSDTRPERLREMADDLAAMIAGKTDYLTFPSSIHHLRYRA
ncbi:unnamed protein product [marine sediment metagenome]|uniref:Uncharacterized protein n=1 Tax=marine sediment metagenome TaxID=412755 RepID=X1BIW3_9ZZZZ